MPRRKTSQAAAAIEAPADQSNPPDTNPTPPAAESGEPAAPMSNRKAGDARDGAASAVEQMPENTEAFPYDATQTEQSTPPRNPVRSWSERYTGPVRYEVLTDSRIHKIIIKFKLPEGQRTPPDEVLAIMRAAKVNGDGSPTGLRFEDSRTHGKAWMIPNDAEGRDLMFAIQTRLEEVGAQPAPAPQPAV